jgi:hypothetical protein
VGGYQKQEQTTDPPESVGRFLGSRRTVLIKSKKIGSKQGIVTAALKNWEKIRTPPVLIHAPFLRDPSGFRSVAPEFRRTGGGDPVLMRA